MKTAMKKLGKYTQMRRLTLIALGAALVILFAGAARLGRLHPKVTGVIRYMMGNSTSTSRAGKVSWRGWIPKLRIADKHLALSGSGRIRFYLRHAYYR